MFRFLKSQPGFETLHIERLQPETGVRETFRITGETMVTVEDYQAGREFPDAVSFSFYPIDLHVEHGVDPKPLERVLFRWFRSERLCRKAAGICSSRDAASAATVWQTPR